MLLALLLKLLHVLTSISFISGLLGRWVALGQAARSDNIRTTRALTDLAGRFERTMVIPGSLILLATGLLTAWAQKQPLLGFLQDASTNWLLVSLVLYLSTIPLIPWVFLPRGRRFVQALDQASTREEVTPELQAAFADRAVAAAHVYELLNVCVILILMVTKPF
jgi:uncharacterized membrane protein